VLLVGARAANDRFVEQLKRKAPPLSGKARAFVDVPIAKVSGRPSLKAGLASLSALALADPAPAFAESTYEEPRGVVAKLQAASFGVAVWSPEELDVLEIAALMGLIDKLNRTTRFTALPLRPGGNSFGGAQLCLSRWGVPPPARFASGGARQMIFTAAASPDPALDADLVLLASSFSDSPAFIPNVPVPAIAIGPNVMASLSPAVAIEAGVLGKDHGGIWYDADQDAYVYVDVPARSAKPSAAELLAEVLRKVRAA
jgi:formylmethanofuran dehydrogenase subunit B